MILSSVGFAPPTHERAQAAEKTRAKRMIGVIKKDMLCAEIKIVSFQEVDL